MNHHTRFPSFRQWIRQHKGERSAIGDLAGDVLADDTWPRGPESLARYEAHLNSLNACEEAVNALREAWNRYENDKATAGKAT